MMKLNPATSVHSRIVMSVLMFTSIGCGSGTSSSSSTATTQPVIPAIPAGWVNINRPYVSYDYPSGWKLTEVTTAAAPSVDEADPTQPTKSQVLVQFVPGYSNNLYTGSGDQCADADQYLTNFYNANFLPLVTDPNKYPRTTVTWQYLPSSGGSLGGATGTVSISYQASVASAVNYLVDLQAVPRTGGLYLIGFWSPDSLSTPSVEKTFLSTLVLSAYLPKGSTCSSLN